MNKHADIGSGTTHHGTPEECGCWRRLAARLGRERDEARAAHKAEYERAEALTVVVADVAQERDVALSELAAYQGDKWSPEHGGSEVDRLKAIIGELDAQKKKALIERNEARAAGNDLYRSLKALRESGVGQSMNYTPWAGGADAVLKKWEEMS